MKFAVSVACVLAAFCVLASELRGKVVGVADGDTITVLDAEKSQHKIRLDKIDAPEKAQAFGEKAKQHLASLVFEKDVRVEWDKTDRYGRTLGEVWLGQTNINLRMVADGFAWHYKHYDKTPSYAGAEEMARKRRLGLWVDQNPMEPYQFRRMRKGTK